MKILFRQTLHDDLPISTEIAPFDLKAAIEKNRQALEIAYSGFDNAVEADMIDSYIYEINSLQMRYRLLVEMAEQQTTSVAPLYK